ncbi:class I SAM-dependent methyltransferase [Desertimonas flava]|uniref:class I SAM-dependent methyltransferase n=1 Tax=Desertimonas flava TaxID=2064846 RepID=UPI000E34E604|nr:class I SAM-dependent methyltransferase [Desertimonas flava]
MGFYAERIFPRLMNRACNTPDNRRIRAVVCAPLAGDVLELGFGSGLNLPHMPPSVRRVLAVDPMQRGRSLAADRIAEAACEVEFVGLDGQVLDLPDDSVDAALSTWTLCSIPDPAAAVREVARVLRPGGTFHFVEHGRSPDPDVRRWQHRLNGIQRRVACGCHLDRDIPAVIDGAGMHIVELETSYLANVPKFLGWTFQGVAVQEAPAES